MKNEENRYPDMTWYLEMCETLTRCGQCGEFFEKKGNVVFEDIFDIEYKCVICNNINRVEK